jgi:hypothetical protein
VERTVVELPRHDADAGPVLGHQEVGGEVFDVEFGIVLEATGRTACAGSRGPCGRRRRRCAAPGGLRRTGSCGRRRDAGRSCPSSVRRERHAVVFQLVDRLGRLAGEVFHRVRVAQPVGALHSVIHVPVPMVRPHVAERSGDAALCRDRVGARGEDLGHAGRLQPLFRHPQRRAQAGAARADHDHVIGVFCDVVVCRRVCNVFHRVIVPLTARSERVRPAPRRRCRS